MAEVLCRIDDAPGRRHAVVTLRHAGRLNAMSRSMWRDLRRVFADLQQHTQVPDPLRCVLVQGADGHFCAGGDISEYPGFRFQEESLRYFHEEEVWGGLQAMLACDATLVAVIEGHCMGAGVEIASCCDIRLAVASSRFGAPIARLGFAMAPREAALVAARLGQTVARAMLLEAATYTAQDLLQAGFITRTTPDAPEALRHEARRSLDKLLALAPAAGARRWPHAQTDAACAGRGCAGDAVAGTGAKRLRLCRQRRAPRRHHRIYRKACAAVLRRLLGGVRRDG